MTDPGNTTGRGATPIDLLAETFRIHNTTIAVGRVAAFDLSEPADAPGVLWRPLSAAVSGASAPGSTHRNSNI